MTAVPLQRAAAETEFYLACSDPQVANLAARGAHIGYLRELYPVDPYDYKLQAKVICEHVDRWVRARLLTHDSIRAGFAVEHSLWIANKLTRIENYLADHGLHDRLLRKHAIFGLLHFQFTVIYHMTAHEAAALAKMLTPLWWLNTDMGELMEQRDAWVDIAADIWHATA